MSAQTQKSLVIVAVLAAILCFPVFIYAAISMRPELPSASTTHPATVKASDAPAAAPVAKTKPEAAVVAAPAEKPAPAAKRRAAQVADVD